MINSPPQLDQGLNFSVALLGARLDYAVPRILHDQGRLEQLFTDFCSNKGLLKAIHTIPYLKNHPALARLRSRVVPDIPSDRIRHFPKFGLEYAQRLRRAKTISEKMQTYLWSGETFCQLILHQGISSPGLYVYNSAGLELLEWCKGQSGHVTVLEQTIAPKSIEMELLETEFQHHPDWEPRELNCPASVAYAEREMAEWHLADRILCGSDFVRQEMMDAGVPGDRIQVVPYGIDRRFQLPPRAPHDGPLRVLTIGTVGLRKGSPYVLAAAQALKGIATFRLIGPLQVSETAQQALTDALDLVGPVPRQQILDHYAWADVFLLPSICEGSAAVTYEALACSLPVITTPNTGSIVEDGVSGYVLPIRDVDGLVERLEFLARHPEKRQTLALNAQQRSEVGTWQSYQQRLLEALSGF